MAISTISLILAATYLIGTLPTAWLVVKRHGQDIREVGSGNVGAMNTFSVTGSKRRFILVFIIDALKGVAAVLCARYLAGEASIPLDATAMLGVVLGHNFNVWLSIPAKRVAGGKGLASALGSLTMSMYWLIPVWLTGFLVGFFLYKIIWGSGKIAPGTTLATLVVPLAAYLLYGTTTSIIMTLTTLAIVIKHIPELKELFSAERNITES
jgi:glycerol-3-phosphate acyltransferase PlsY